MIVNEFGAVNMDSQLITRRLSNGVVEMSNGCVCCTVQQDLRDGLRQLLDQRRDGSVEFDHIVLETTGLAKTGPIIQTISSNDLKSELRLGLVVTVVDSFHASSQLDDFTEAQEQIGMADLLLLNKIDLVEPKKLEALTTRLAKINGVARMTRCVQAGVDAAAVLSADMVSASHIDRLSECGNDHRDCGDEHNHGHTDHVQTFVIGFSEPLDHGRVQDWLSYLIMRYTEQMLRYKGILNIAGRSSRVVLQGVHAMVGVESDRDWGPGEVRKSELVFIGRNLPEHEIRQGLESCIAEDSA